ncbi:MAG TPA: DUF4468 domain-containing protein [Bacteroidota bacterium]|nr:DUF4468 domain-containing protein [Bacteroidota bacterium]
MKAIPAAATLLLASCLLAMTGRAIAQEATKEEMNHDFIFDFSGHPKQEIYERTMRWITNNLRSPKAVIQSEDAESGSIVANGVTTMTVEGDSVASGLSFRMSVDVREGKERVRFLDVQISRGPDEGWDQIPREGVWHRGAQKRFVVIARNLSEYVRLKGEP